MEGLLHDHDFTPRCQAVLIQQSEMFMHVAGIWQWSYKPPWHRILLIAAMNNILPMIALCLCFVHHKRFWYPSKYQMLSEWQAAAVLQHHCNCNYILTASVRINDKIRILQQWNCYRFFINLLEVLIAKSSSLPQKKLRRFWTEIGVPPNNQTLSLIKDIYDRIGLSYIICVLLSPSFTINLV